MALLFIIFWCCIGLGRAIPCNPTDRTEGDCEVKYNDQNQNSDVKIDICQKHSALVENWDCTHIETKRNMNPPKTDTITICNCENTEEIVSYFVEAHGAYYPADSLSTFTKSLLFPEKIIWKYDYKVVFFQNPGQCLTNSDALAIRKMIEDGDDRFLENFGYKVKSEITKGQEIENYIFGRNTGIKKYAGVWQVKRIGKKQKEVNKLYKVTDDKTFFKLTDLAEALKENGEVDGTIYWLCCSTKWSYLSKAPEIGDIRKNAVKAAVKTQSDALIEKENIYDKDYEQYVAHRIERKMHKLQQRMIRRHRRQNNF